MDDLDDWVQQQRNEGRNDAEIRHILEQHGVNDDRIDDVLTTSSYTGFVLATAITILILTTTAYALYEPPTQSPAKQAPATCNTQRCLANAATTCGPTTYTANTTPHITIQPVNRTCQLIVNTTNQTVTCTITVEELTTRLNTWQATNNSFQTIMPANCQPTETSNGDQPV